MNTKHVVMWSGGITSWATARRVAEQYGTSNLTLLFADTLVEDEDLYRFSEQAAASIGLKVTVVADGRTPQEVSRDRKFLASNRVPLCSLHLKQEPCRDWLDANCAPADTILYVGIDWSEMHRINGVRRGYNHRTASGCRDGKLCASLFRDGERLDGPGCPDLLTQPWRVEFPLCEPPYTDKRDLMAGARKLGIEPPRLYGLGFQHNNCGGACVRGGQGQWAHLLKTFPDRYASWETFEQEMRDRHGDVAVLKDRRGGVSRPLPLTVLRSRIEAEERREAERGTLFDADDWGGCGCTTALDDLAGLGGAA